MNRLTKLLLSTAVIVLIIGATFWVNAGKSRQGLIKISRSAPSVTTIKKQNLDTATFFNDSLQNVKRDISAINKLSLKNKQKIIKPLEDIEKKIKSFNKQLNVAKSDLEKKSITHLAAHEQLEDKMVYYKKIAELPVYLDKISKQTSAIRKSYKKQLTLNLDLSTTLKKVDKKIALIRNFHKKGDYDKAYDTIEDLREEVLKNFYEYDSESDPFFSNGSRGFAKEIRNLRRLIQIDLPNKVSNLALVPPTPSHGYDPDDAEDVDIFVCVMRWEDEAPVVKTRDLDTEIDKLEAYVLEMTYGQIGNFTVRYGVNVLWDGDTIPEDDSSTRLAAIEMCDPFIDYNDVDVFILFPSMGYNSNSLTGNSTFLTEDGEVGFSAINIIDSQFNVGVLAHEFGHAYFSLFHANFIHCGEDIFARSGCNFTEYGNPFDVMGTTTLLNATLPLHLNTWYKYLSGIIEPFVEITEDGIYPLAVNELNMSPMPQLLRIPGEPAGVCFEYRKPILHDSDLSIDNISTIAGFDDYDAGIPEEGCLFLNMCNNQYEKNTYRARSPNSYLIDTHPRSDISPGLQSYDACLREGESVSIPELGINSLSYNQSTANTINVNIDIDESQLAIIPNLVASLDVADRCRFTSHAIFEPYIHNSESMIPLNPFKIHLIGIDEAGHESLLEEYLIEDLKAGDVPIFTYNDISEFEEIQLIYDVENSIAESDETDNVFRVSKYCSG